MHCFDERRKTLGSLKYIQWVSEWGFRHLGVEIGLGQAAQNSCPGLLLGGGPTIHRFIGS